jgi:hypothetical protein
MAIAIARQVPSLAANNPSISDFEIPTGTTLMVQVAFF